MANPSYVRLVSERTTGLVVDMESGWSISGWDVKEFPEDDYQARYVKQQLNRGVLESASSEEFEAAHPDPPEETDADAFVRAVQAASGRGGFQGSASAHQANLQRRKLIEARQTGGDDGEGEIERRKQVVEDQKKQGLSGDTKGSKKEPATT